MRFSKIKEIVSSDFIGTIIIAFLAIFAIPMICSLVVLNIDENAVKNEIIMSDEIMINTISQYVEREVSSVVSTANAIEQIEYIKTIKEYDSELGEDGQLVKNAYKLSGELKKHISKNVTVEDACVVFNEADMVVSSTMFESRKDFFDKYYADMDVEFKEWKDTISKNVYGKYHIIMEENNPKYIEFFFSTSFFKNVNSVPVIIQIRISPKRFAEYVLKIYEMNDKELYILDKNNSIIFHIGEAIFKNPDYGKLSDSPDFEEKENYILTSIKSNYNNWKYVLCTNKAFITEKVQYLKMIVFINILFYLIMTILFFSIFIIKNYLPVRKFVYMIGGEKKIKYELFENVASEYNTYKYNINKYKKRYEETEKERFFDNLVSVGGNRLALEKEAKTANVQFVSEYFVLIMIDIYNYQTMFEYDEIDDSERKASSKFVVKNIFEELFEKIGRANIFFKNDKLICILNINEPLQTWYSDVKKLLEYGKNLIEKQFNFYIAVNVGNVCEGIEQISNAYYDVVAMYKKSKFIRNKEIVFFDEVSQEVSDNAYNEEYIDRLIWFIEAGDGKSANELLERIIKTFMENQLNSYYALKIFVIRLISDILKILNEKDLKSEEFYGDINSILEFESYEKCKECLKRFIEFSCVCMNEAACGDEEKKESSNKTMVDKIKSYIAEKYSDSSITVAHVGNCIGVTSYYASRTFKERTGENLSDYISRYRIEKAKEILSENSKIPISQLYEMVGFGSERTFMRMFTKYEKITVSQYKKIIKSDK